MLILAKGILVIGMIAIGLLPGNAPAAGSLLEPELVEEAKPKPKTMLEEYLELDGEHGGQCMEFIQRKFETYYTHPDFRGIAGEVKPNSLEPKLGGVVITREGAIGHVALIVEIREESLILAESNFENNDETIRVSRKLEKDSEQIVGYFNF